MTSKANEIPANATCASCRWVRELHDDDKVYFGWGECQVAPPVIVPCGDGESRTVRPVIKETDCCAQWQLWKNPE